MNNDSNLKLIAITGLIIFAAVSRFIPHPPNFAPVMAMALFGGAVFADKKFAFFIPLAAMMLSDLFLGLYPYLPFVYLSYIVVVFLGFTMRNKITAGKVVLNSIAASIIFFVLTNLGFWLFGGMYPLTFEGLSACFTAAIAFYRYPALGIETSFFLNTILGTLIYSGVLFGSLALAEKYVPQLKLSPAKSD